MSRFEGMERLYGTEGCARLARARVLVVGLGGVGSWVVESLARSGVGGFALIDGDDVCVSNMNRQLHALESTIGHPKADVLAERVRQINPACEVSVIPEFFGLDTVERHLAQRFDYVVDAIDGVTNKAALIAGAHERGMPAITCGGAGGKRAPLQVRLADLSLTHGDRLLMFVRKKLRRRFQFPARGSLFGVPCVYSPEPVQLPEGCTVATGAGSEEMLERMESDALACEGRLGSAAFVTGAFGLAVAAHIVNGIAAPPTGLRSAPFA